MTSQAEPMALVSSTQGPTGTLMRMWVVHPKWVSQELHAGTTFHVVMLVGVTPQLAHRQEKGSHAHPIQIAPISFS